MKAISAFGIALGLLSGAAPAAWAAGKLPFGGPARRATGTPLARPATLANAWRQPRIQSHIQVQEWLKPDGTLRVGIITDVTPKGVLLVPLDDRRTSGAHLEQLKRVPWDEKIFVLPELLDPRGVKPGRAVRYQLGIGMPGFAAECSVLGCR